MFADLAPPSDALFRTGAASSFAAIEVHDDPVAIADAWAELERAAPCSIYQTRRFLEPWTRALGARQGLQPRYVLARDGSNRPIALLCLGLAQRGPLKVACLLGGRDANLQLALFDPSAEWSPRPLRELLHAAAALVGADLLWFTNQPRHYGGLPNPLAGLNSVNSPSDAYGMPLPADAETLFSAKLSRDARKKLRKKAARLATLGTVTYEIARGPAEIATVLNVLFAQKAARFRELGIVADLVGPAMRRFLEEAAMADPPGVELHALAVDKRIVATYCGAAHRGRWSGMINSFDNRDVEVARCSPGDLLLHRIVADCCIRGLTAFDLGVGEARYKAALCDETIPLIDAAIGFGVLGRAAAALVLARQRLKRQIKRSPRLLAGAKRLRAYAASSTERSSGSADDRAASGPRCPYGGKHVEHRETCAPTER